MHDTPAPPPAPLPSYSSVAAAAEKLTGLVDTYRYVNADGKTDFVVFRLNPKSFRQLSRGPSGWQFTAAHLTRLPLFNRLSLAKNPDAPVLFVEGEKAVKYLHDIGILATTTPGGAGNGEKCDLSPLAGRTVYVWPDNDEAGRGHARAVKESLEWLEPPADVWLIETGDLNLAPKAGADDYAAAHEGGKDDKRNLIELTLQEFAYKDSAGDRLRRRLEDMMSGKLTAIGFPWRSVGSCTLALQPGKTMILAGKKGTSKSLWMMQAIAHWVGLGIKVACYMLEDDKETHTTRALAQLSSQSGITNPHWVKANGAQALEFAASCKEQIDKIGRCLYDMPDKVLRINDAAKWVERQCEAGARIIIIDPVTALDMGKEPWNASMDFLLKTRGPLMKAGASMICVTHPSADGKKLAGGEAWDRFAHTILHLRTVDEKEVVIKMLKGLPGDPRMTINRELYVDKARNGPGTGATIGMWFNPDSLLFDERGVIEKERKRK